MQARVFTTMRVAVFVAAAFLVAAAWASQAVAVPRLTVTSPRPFQVIQRGPSGTADITVRGSAVGAGPRVQVRWGAGVWVSAPVAADGAFRVVLRGRPAGQGTLTVRSQTTPSVSSSVRFVGVGDVYVVAGQSNASGRGTLDTRYEHPLLRAVLFGNDDRWTNHAEPVDSPVRQVDDVSRDRPAHGSVWPLVATSLMAAEPVPVAFVPCALGTTSIYAWLPDPIRPFSRATLYGSMVRRARAVGGVRAVLFWQGEADARAQVSQAAYGAALSDLAARVQADLGVPLVAAQIGDYDTRYTAAGVNGIRLAQEDVWRQGTAFAGPVLYDIDLHGRVHFTQPSELQEAARRWAASILSCIGRLDVPVGPKLIGASYDDWLTVSLSFAVPGGELRPGPAAGITLQVPGGDPVAFQYAAVTGPSTVSVYLFSPVTEPLVVSLGSGREAAGKPVPVEASSWELPALPFVGVSVTDERPASLEAAGPQAAVAVASAASRRWRLLGALR